LKVPRDGGIPGPCLKAQDDARIRVAPAVLQPGGTRGLGYEVGRRLTGLRLDVYVLVNGARLFVNGAGHCFMQGGASRCLMDAPT
jgi:hypothetical protein